MIISAQTSRDKWLEKVYKKAMAELDEFFELNWQQNQPKVFIVKNRKEIDKIWNQKTPKWLVGWGGRQSGVYILDRKNFKKESDNTYTKERYSALLKHELAHCFTDILTDGYRKPVWLNEGISIYLSGQLKQYEQPKKYKHFLKSFDKQKEGVYAEAGWVVKTLVEKHGKKKLFDLLKQIKTTKPNKKEFNKIFKEIYGVKTSITQPTSRHSLRKTGKISP
ncbi:hypothetical protein KKG65_03835 [Patescibacteria group bacterium]|nr:hypothetical protein [Patescibacteria group bacterium]